MLRSAIAPRKLPSMSKIIRLKSVDTSDGAMTGRTSTVNVPGRTVEAGDGDRVVTGLVQRGGERLRRGAGVTGDQDGAVRLGHGEDHVRRPGGDTVGPEQHRRADLAGVGVNVNVGAEVGVVSSPVSWKIESPKSGPSGSTGSSHWKSIVPPAPPILMVCATSVPGPGFASCNPPSYSAGSAPSRFRFGADHRCRDQPHRRLPGVLLALVARGAEVVDAVGRDLVDGVGDHAVGEHRLVEVGDVVDDDVRTAGTRLVGEVADVVGEVELPAVGGREAQLRPGRDVVGDLEHPAALVVAAVGVLDHHHRLRVARVAGAGEVSDATSSAAWISSGSPKTSVVAVS